MAKQRRLSDTRVLVELIDQAIEVRQQKERAFFEFAEQFRDASDPEEVKRLGEELWNARSGALATEVMRCQMHFGCLLLSS
jgi:hypothetical protein